MWQIVKCYCAHSLNTYRDSGLKTQIESFSVVCLLPLTTKTPWNRENRFVFFCSTKNVIENTMFQWNKRSMFFFGSFSQAIRNRKFGSFMNHDIFMDFATNLYKYSTINGMEISIPQKKPHETLSVELISIDIQMLWFTESISVQVNEFFCLNELFLVN